MSKVYGAMCPKGCSILVNLARFGGSLRQAIVACQTHKHRGARPFYLGLTKDDPRMPEALREARRASLASARKALKDFREAQASADARLHALAIQAVKRPSPRALAMLARQGFRAECRRIDVKSAQERLKHSREWWDSRLSEDIAMEKLSGGRLPPYARRASTGPTPSSTKSPMGQVEE